MVGPFRTQKCRAIRYFPDPMLALPDLRFVHCSHRPIRSKATFSLRQWETYLTADPFRSGR